MQTDAAVRSATPTDAPRKPAAAFTKQPSVVGIPTDGKLKSIASKLERPAVNIDFLDLFYSVKTANGKKIILDGISGSLESGKLSGIMGPSGAGKTTLMDILLGFVTSRVEGTILTNGHPRKLHVFNKLTAYIMQEDLLRPHLSVEESMMTAAHLKLGDKFSQHEKIEVINEIIKCMGLKRCRHVRTNYLSGGERKRTSIALELVNNPSVLFLDEPTTGLDTVATTQCLKLLKDLSRHGRTIVSTLHQPSSSLFYMLDHVYFMANGHCVYQGSPDQLVTFLSEAGLKCKSTYNPADFILETLSKNVEQELSQKIQNGKIIQGDRDDQRALELQEQNLDASWTAFNVHDNSSLQFPTSFTDQLLILYKRKLLIQCRDTTSLWILLGHHIFSALVYGSIFFNVGNDGSRPFDNFKFCFAVLVYFSFTYAIIPVLVLPQEMEQLKREYFNRWYSLKAYYVMTLFSTLPVMITFGTLFNLVVYSLSDQPLEWYRFFMFSLAGIMAGCISEGYGTFIGTLCECGTGSILTPAVVAPQIAIGFYGLGFGQAVEPFMKFLMSLTYIRSVLVVFCLSLYGQRPDMYCPPDQVLCFYKNPATVLRDLGMSDNSMVNQCVMLFIFYFVVRAMIFFALKFRLDKELSLKIAVFTNLLKGKDED